MRQDVSRRQFLGAGATAGLSLSALGASATVSADEHAPTYENPIGPFGMGDPDLVRTCDGTYYIFGTETPEDVVPIFQSEDLVDWTYVGSVFDEPPDWRSDPDAGVWAPTVSRYDGQYYLYYSYSTWGSQDNPGIGLATADDPTGPWEDQGPVFRNEDLPVTNTIDPDFLVDDGTPYLVWGSWYGLYVVELTPDGREIVPGTEVHLCGDLKEGPMIVRENGYYYLFYSTGNCCDQEDSTYEVEVGRSESLFGPYYNQNGDDLRGLDEHHDGVPVMSGTDRFFGPGHNTAVQDDDGDWWMLYHSEATTNYPNRILMLDPIRWDDDDWPIVGDDGEPTTEHPVPATHGSPDCGTPADVAAGTYQLTNANSDLELGVGSDPATEGASAVQSEQAGAATDAWTFEPDGDDEYVVEHAQGGQRLEVAEAGTDNGDDVRLWPANDHDAQRWRVLAIGDEYLLENVHSGRHLQVAAGSHEDGANVVQWAWPTGSHHRWTLEPIEAASPCEAAGAAGGEELDTGDWVCDVDGDGNYRDLTASGDTTTQDLQHFFEHQHTEPYDSRPDLFDFTDNGDVGQPDVVDLFHHI